MTENTSSGTLFVLATPIGNLKDISLRAIEILKSADLILSEDTRETSKILNEYNIATPQIPYTDQKHSNLYPKIVEFLDLNKKLVLVSDSGTPVVSDPGFKLVYQLKQENYDIKSIPGPSALVTALSVSGLPTDKFVFLGFLPKSETGRKEIIKKYGELDATLTIYESPYRVKRLLSEIHETLGNRVVCIAKDLTKKFEHIKTGHLEEFITNPKEIKERGEYVILIAKKDFIWINKPSI